ncbi:MAG: preprotein translocase subunit YajC, partial [Candidatus Cloacimonadaceae bacterium]|nr:preprotein translocase subunit YajC [Candidatus Cloacimonadaceae bacterium]
MTYTLLQANTGSTGSTGSGGGLFGSPIIFMVLIFGIMYFLMIRPQQKRQKEMQKMLDSLQVNDKVLTSSGIYGRVVT